jgi:hypothetical protein
MEQMLGVARRIRESSPGSNLTHPSFVPKRTESLGSLSSCRSYSDAAGNATSGEVQQEFCQLVAALTGKIDPPKQEQSIFEIVLVAITMDQWGSDAQHLWQHSSVRSTAPSPLGIWGTFGDMRYSYIHS